MQSQVYRTVEVVGDRVKLENRVSFFRGARLGSGDIVGWHACRLNDKRPQALTAAGDLKNDSDWVARSVTLLDRASLGGGSSCFRASRSGVKR